MLGDQVYTIDEYDGGIADKPNRGVRGSFRFGHGINLRDNLSTLSCNQRMKKESGTVVTDLIRFFVPATDGNTYGFGSSGKIYRRTAGVWTLVYTDPDGDIRGAEEFEHKETGGAGAYVAHLVWATQTKVKKVKLSDTGFSSVVTVGTFVNGVLGDYHTMLMALGVLVIADGSKLALLDYEGAFNNEALDLPPILRIQTLIEQNTDIIIGASERAKSKKGWVFTWDRIQPSWIVKRDVQAQGVNSMTFFEGGMLMQAGTNGAMRYWDLVNMLPIKNFPGGGLVNPGANAEHREVIHFGVWGGTKNGIYSYGRNQKNSPFSLNLEYLLSPVLAAGTIAQIESKMADAALELGALTSVDGTLLASWKDGSTFGVDVIDTENKAPAVYESMVFNAGRPEIWKLFRGLKAVTKSLPVGTSVAFKYRTNAQVDWQDTVQGDGSTHIAAGQSKGLFPLEGTGEEYELRVELTPAGNLTPEVVSLNSFYENESFL